MRVLTALWFIPFTVVNALIWRVVPCPWSKPYDV